VSGPRCEQWRGRLAVDVIGQLPSDERSALAAHLERCVTCRHEHDELLRMAQFLPAADPGHFEDDPMPAHLEEAVLGRLADDARRERRRRRAWLGTGAVAGAAAVAAVAAVLALASSPAPGRTVALAGGSGVSASARLTPEPWGTALALTESGEPGGRVLWVSMRTIGGGWWDTGTYTTVAGRRVSVEMSCALATSRITGIWVRDAQGRTVLHGYVEGT